MERLLRRRDFLSAAGAPYVSTPALVMQARLRAEPGPARVGFTCTKKLGNAVVRNRIRRRLKEAARLTLPGLVNASTDYVLIGRSAAATRGFEDLRKDIISALNRLHAGKAQMGQPRARAPKAPNKPANRATANKATANKDPQP